MANKSAMISYLIRKLPKSEQIKERGEYNKKSAAEIRKIYNFRKKYDL
jgi:hypothetical protein